MVASKISIPKCIYILGLSAHSIRILTVQTKRKYFQNFTFQTSTTTILFVLGIVCFVLKQTSKNRHTPKVAAPVETHYREVLFCKTTAETVSFSCFFK